MPDKEGDHYIPIDPQSFLSYIETIESAKGQTVSLETHIMLMVSISQAIAAVEFEDIDAVSPQWLLDRVSKWLEHLVAEVPTLQNPDALRAEVQRLRESTEHWQRHFRA